MLLIYQFLKIFITRSAWPLSRAFLVVYATLLMD